ncbi:MAG: hypothetical protein LBD29_10310 [Treponema sp.]|nr:hypothetical protein [Treponema sp.]
MNWLIRLAGFAAGGCFLDFEAFCFGIEPRSFDFGVPSLDYAAISWKQYIYNYIKKQMEQ